LTENDSRIAAELYFQWLLFCWRKLVMVILPRMKELSNAKRQEGTYLVHYISNRVIRFRTAWNVCR